MTTPSAAEQSLREGDPAGALRLLQDDVRKNPADAKLRVFLFQLLAVLGDWQRAVNQLSVAAELDAGALAMAQTYREAVLCESLREQVFAGQKSPIVLGEPAPWLAYLIEALSHSGAPSRATALREHAFEEAPASSGTLDGEAFEWIADADMRLGPVLEVIVDGRYYWVPFDRLAHLTLEAPSDLRDVVWAPAKLQLRNGGETVALIPGRYPNSQLSGDAAIVLGRKTVWQEPQPKVFHGLGQKVLTTNTGEKSLLDIREIRLNA